MAAQQSDATIRQSSPSTAADYARGSTDRERQRLMRQGAIQQESLLLDKARCHAYARRFTRRFCCST
jgi:hypothetical protein